MAPKLPNILILTGDDIGYWNISANNRGMMGYQTPNIDRIAREGLSFSDYYGQQSCTAGRAAFITGQNPLRTGLTKVGLPGADTGLSSEDPTIADFLKSVGYVTGQFGKNHLGDKDEFLPTNHGFDEFFGNLYHLNAEEEPEDPDYPKDPEFKKKYGPRGVLHSFANGKIEDTGPLNRARMATIDDEINAQAIRFMEQAKKAEKPFFVWWNSTHMHFRTYLKPGYAGKSGQGFYNDAMVYHDEQVGGMLNKLDELGIASDTLVLYTTDNGPHYNTWPDGGITPFRGEKNTNWEGGYRVPAFARWPGHFPAGKMLNGIVGHTDWFSTLATVAGVPGLKERMMNGYKLQKKSFKVMLDSYDLLPYLTGEVAESPRQSFFYVNDDAELVALRVKDWKIVFQEQRAKTMQCWAEPFVKLRVPKIFHLRRDPFERADENSNSYWEWVTHHAFMIPAAQGIVAQEIQLSRDFPARQKPASFNLDRVMDVLKNAATGPA
ncbi:MAG TPA: arylsulfatase [Oligoflexus sp.]|uniref:arylsulfatase n=1 Tax=Oligoflexus sp. TaxID=1971216 RepID=UPI002D6B2293|nr:arylsulfatase [Oligoflexus sp.]HYX35841.1 arylsulfatase [Oligoflexus sp.]